MKTLLAFLLFVILFVIGANAGDINTQYSRVMACQTPDSRLYIEIFHDQSGFMGAPKNPTGYLILWATTMGKDTQKRLVMDVPMKHVTSGSGCALDVKWSQKKYDGTNTVSDFNAVIANCGVMNSASKGKLIQNDIHPDGKITSAQADLNCQIQ